MISCGHTSVVPLVHPAQGSNLLINPQQKSGLSVGLPFYRHCAMSSFWADACLRARNAPLQQQFDAVYGVCSTTVSRCFRIILFALHADSDALPSRLLRIVCALSSAAPCFIFGGGSTKMTEGTCGTCTDGFAGSLCAVAASESSHGLHGCRSL